MMRRRENGANAKSVIRPLEIYFDSFNNSPVFSIPPHYAETKQDSRIVFLPRSGGNQCHVHVSFAWTVQLHQHYGLPGAEDQFAG